MNIAIIGYGKMGQMIEKKALERGHQIGVKIDKNSTDLDWELVSKCDVAIEFSLPEKAVENIRKCFEYKVPVIVGTTGWLNDYETIKQECLKNNASFLSASNFSIGVNLFFHLNKILAQAMDSLPEYNVKIEEIHHTQKKDAPSGTAITLAEGILQFLKRKKSWSLANETQGDDVLSINAIRENEVPGTHHVTYTSEIDEIEIKHKAFNRSGFAIGAVIAAEWIVDKKGVFTMNDLIGF
ncbi:MAG: 4-hydroxy-tetrahydrodipicolinate reductase [Bacteroidota bacterium]|nr:4-hydroxy-tetrahydrodipicolinate reductase [Bacteroidota bacterium]